MNRHSKHNWIEAAAELSRRGDAYVVVTLLNIKGSAPRESGTKMLVTSSGIVDSIGGGHLEFMAIERARTLLKAGTDQQHIEDFALGAKLGQCCGGRVSLLFECFAHTAAQVVVFGAGHVARALIPLLAQLPVNVRWVDSRSHEFPDAVPANCEKIIADNVVDEVADLPSHAYVIVMTHEHPLDYGIAEAVLKRGDACYLGVIGSVTKARRFKMRLAHRGFSEDNIAQMHCPIGLQSVPGKRPMEIAVSIAAELISTYHGDIKTQANKAPSHQDYLNATIP